MKKTQNTQSLNEVSYFRESILEDIANGNWYINVNVLQLSICRLHEIGYRKLGHFESAIEWQINAEKVLSRQ